MQKKLAVASLVALVASFSMLVASAQSSGSNSNSIKGVWRIVASGPADHMVDRRAVGMSGMIFVGDGYWMYATESGDAPRPPLPQGGAAAATADQLRASWGPMDAQGGPYVRKGDELELRHIIAKGVAAYSAPANSPLVVSFKVEGNTGTITQVRSAAGPFQNPVSWKVERLE
jgi:hypothetical protein